MQEKKLWELWAEHGQQSAGAATDAIAAAMAVGGDRLPRAAIAAKLQALGLRRGVLTPAQVLRALYYLVRQILLMSPAANTISGEIVGCRKEPAVDVGTSSA